MSVKTILSFGAGVNSTAILALGLLKKLPMPDYIVFSDTGAEWPHTYKYMDYLEKKGIKITYLEGGKYFMTLIEYCQMKNFIPSRMNRWCTDYWKITPVNRFRQSFGIDTKMIIGIDAGEAHRVESKPRRYEIFPLVELGIRREECKSIIKKAGLGIPRKSGCYICPYQRKRQWIELKKYHPKLWQVAVDLEKGSISKYENFTYKQGMNDRGVCVRSRQTGGIRFWRSIRSKM